MYSQCPFIITLSVQYGHFSICELYYLSLVRKELFQSILGNNMICHHLLKTGIPSVCFTQAHDCFLYLPFELVDTRRTQSSKKHWKQIYYQYTPYIINLFSKLLSDDTSTSICYRTLLRKLTYYFASRYQEKRIEIYEYYQTLSEKLSSLENELHSVNGTYREECKEYKRLYQENIQFIQDNESKCHELNPDDLSEEQLEELRFDIRFRYLQNEGFEEELTTFDDIYSNLNYSLQTTTNDYDAIKNILSHYFSTDISLKKWNLSDWTLPEDKLFKHFIEVTTHNQSPHSPSHDS